MFTPIEKSHLEVPLEENVNRVIDEGTVEARTIEDAIAVLRYWLFPSDFLRYILRQSESIWFWRLKPISDIKISGCIIVPCLCPARGLKRWSTIRSGGWKQHTPRMRRPICLALKRRTPTWGCRSWSNNWRRSGWKHQRTPWTSNLAPTTQSEATALLPNFFLKTVCLYAAETSIENSFV